MTFTTIKQGLPLQLPANLAPDKPIRMLNLVRFKPQAEYDSTTDLPQVSGQEAYFARYIPAFNVAADQRGGVEVVFLSTNLTGLVGPSDEHWDAVGLIEYPSIKHFEDIISSKEYRETAAKHRLAALEDWRLIACGT